MLMHIAEDHSSATVVSFPRDLVVPIPSCPDPAGGSFDAMSAQPINVTLSYGGLPCTVLTVEALTGLSIPFAAEIQFNGVIEMSNAVGGVPVCVVDPIDDEYTGSTSRPAPTRCRGRMRSASCARGTVSATAATSAASRRSRCSSPRSCAP